MKNYYQIKIETVKYIINTTAFFIFTFIYSYFFKPDGSGLNYILKKTINSEKPYWIICIVFIYYLLSFLMFFIYKYIKLDCIFDFYQQALINAPKMLLTLGSSFSGILFFTCLNINQFNEIKQFYFFVSTMIFFLIILGLGLILMIFFQDLDDYF